MPTRIIPNKHSDAAKAKSATEYRNKSAQKKAPDMPEDKGRHQRSPADYSGAAKKDH